MPELPEVETTLRGIEPAIAGQVINSIRVHQGSLRWPVNPNLAQLVEGQTVTHLSRRAKYLLMQLDQGSMLVHLGMSGSLRIVQPNEELRKHDHIEMQMSNGSLLRFHDPRRFGCWLWSEGPHQQLAHLGPEPLSDDFNGQRLYQLSRRRKVAVKPFIMDNKIVEVFIPGPAGRMEAKYYKSDKITSPIALVLQPHPQYGGTMNNKVVVDTFHTFMENDFSVCRVNFRGVGKSDGEFDNGQGELADAAAALDWLERENFDNSQCWVSGFSFGSLIAMQLLMRRPEINRFIAISPQPNVYDFSFLSPCPTSGLMIYGKKDELVPLEHITDLDKRLSAQKGIKVDFQAINDANHFFTKTEDVLVKNLDKYIKKESALF